MALPNGDPQGGDEQGGEPKPTAPPAPPQSDPGDEDTPLTERGPNKVPPEPVTQPSEAMAVALARIDRLH